MFTKITLCLFVTGILAISGYPVEDAKSEVVVDFTTVRSASDDVDVTTVVSDDTQSDDVVTTSAPIIVVREDVLIPEAVKTEEVSAAVTDVPAIVEEKKVIETVVEPAVEPVVVAEVVGNKVVPIVEIVEVKAVPTKDVTKDVPAANKI